MQTHLSHIHCTEIRLKNKCTHIQDCAYGARAAVCVRRFYFSFYFYFFACTRFIHSHISFEYIVAFFHSLHKIFFCFFFATFFPMIVYFFLFLSLPRFDHSSMQMHRCQFKTIANWENISNRWNALLLCHGYV